MRPRDVVRAEAIEAGLLQFAEEKYPLPGIAPTVSRAVLVEQIVESLRRIEYVHVLRTRPLDVKRSDPSSELFEPIKAAVSAQSRGELDEAFWLVFLAVHFGKGTMTGWRLLRDVYGRLGDGDRWTWDNVRNDTGGFLGWLDAHEGELRARRSRFGNHRKYESIAITGTGETIASYVAWVTPPRSHSELFDAALVETENDPYRAFDFLYSSMQSVFRFGRLARFDYLCMLAKIGLAHIEPGIPYMQGATGPLHGARLLFDADWTARTMDARVSELGRDLDVPMQALEDALCNWQKSPDEFCAFRG